MVNNFKCNRIGGKEISCKSLMRQANPRTIANKAIGKNPKCTVHDGDNNGNILTMGIAVIYKLLKKEADLIKIPEIYNGKSAGMQLKLVDGTIIGADDTSLNGTCLDDSNKNNLTIYAEVRNPSIQGKINLV